MLTRYLSDYARRLFDRREYVRHLLVALAPVAPELAEAVGRVASRQVRADGSAPEEGGERAAAAREIDALRRYFAPGGDVDVLLDRAQGWVAEITRHARRLSDQNAGGTVRAELLLELARRFCACADVDGAERLAQIAFGLTLPLHWRGVAPAPSAGHGPGDPWQRAPVVVPLQAVRRGRRGRLPEQRTTDRTAEELARMLADQADRQRAAHALAAVFPADGTLDLADLWLAEPVARQRLLHLLYRALSQSGRAAVGYRDWAVTVEGLRPAEMAAVSAPDGCLILPRFRMRLHRGRDAAGGSRGAAGVPGMERAGGRPARA